MKKLLIISCAAIALVSGLSGCKPNAESKANSEASVSAEKPRDEWVLKDFIDEAGSDYVMLGLQFKPYDKNYVDAFTGDPALLEQAEAEPRPLAEIISRTAGLRTRIDRFENFESFNDDADLVARHKLLRADVNALNIRARMMNGETFTFDEETRELYDAVAPQYSEADFAAARAKNDAANEARDKSGEPPTRIIPQDKVRAVMSKAIEECRTRTLAHYDLPETESFDLEFVTDKPWSAYNWYKGDYRSLIEVNQDIPLTIERALDLGCHEGYPGHHVYNVRAEKFRKRQKGWPEAQLVPLYSPSSPLMEGSANYGLELAFPGLEKKRYDAEVLYPLAGLTPPSNITEADPDLADARRVLANVGIHVAREYLDGRMSRDEAIEFYMKYGGRSQKRAEQGLDFIDTYRGYIINYTLGQDVVRDWVAMRVEAGEEPWEAFKYLLDTPVTVGQLQEDLKGK